MRIKCTVTVFGLLALSSCTTSSNFAEISLDLEAFKSPEFYNETALNNLIEKRSLAVVANVGHGDGMQPALHKRITHDRFSRNKFFALSLSIAKGANEKTLSYAEAKSSINIIIKEIIWYDAWLFRCNSMKSEKLHLGFSRTEYIRACDSQVPTHENICDSIRSFSVIKDSLKNSIIQLYFKNFDDIKLSDEIKFLQKCKYDKISANNSVPLLSKLIVELSMSDIILYKSYGIDQNIEFYISINSSLQNIIYPYKFQDQMENQIRSMCGDPSRYGNLIATSVLCQTIFQKSREAKF